MFEERGISKARAGVARTAAEVGGEDRMMPYANCEVNRCPCGTDVRR